MKLGFISGCFDGFHEGHKYILQECLSNCDQLFVAINADDYIRRNKNRDPLKTELERIRAIYNFFPDQAISCILFHEDSPINIIHCVRPDIIFCGDDYTKEQVVGHELAEVVLIKRLPGISTSKIISEKGFLSYEFK